MANPPITIGPFTNVPAPGSAIQSAWAQQLTQYAVDNAIPNYINGASTTGLLRIIAASAVVTTNSGGLASIIFPGVPFASSPVVLAAIGDLLATGAPTQPAVVQVQAAPAVGSFNLSVLDFNGARILSTAVRVNYLAIGRRT